MSRRNIYDLVRLNYNVYNEVQKIHGILTHDNFFYCTDFKTKGDEHRIIKNYLFFEFADQVLFTYLPAKGTCMSLMEFMNNANAILKFGDNGNLSEARIVNYLEVVENLLHVYFKNSSTFRKNHGYDYYTETYNKVTFLMNELERYLNITRVVKKDIVILKRP